MRDLELLGANLEALTEQGRVDLALRLLQNANEQHQTYHQAERFLHLLESVPEPLRQELIFQRIYLQTLARARRPKDVLAWFESNTPADGLHLYRAWALLQLNQNQQAMELLQSLCEASVPDRGLYYRCMGMAMNRLKQPGWQDCFEQARAHLQGNALGRMLLDYGWHLYSSGQHAPAHATWAEALIYLESDPYYLAWTHSNIGYLLLKNKPAEAEQHFLEALRISQKKAAHGFRSRALLGLGIVRRMFGELQRALQAYQEAYKVKGDADDTQLALWGWGHTLRLMGQVEEGLAKLLQAYRINPEERWIELDIAAAYLMLGHLEYLEQKLPYLRTIALKDREKIQLGILEAEWLRCKGDLAQAQARLASVESNHFWFREELSCFPLLASAVQGAQTRVRAAYRVEVNPYGRLEVRVNDRAVPLPAVSKAGELLVFLLIRGGSASLEVLLDQIATPGKNPRKALWEVVNSLRLTLGWKDSVRSTGRMYTLDPESEWVFPTEPPLDHQGQLLEFMPGYYSNWIEEYRQQWNVI